MSRTGWLMGGKLTIRIVCLVGLPITFITGAAICQPLFGQASVGQSPERARKIRRLPEAAGVEIPIHPSPVKDTLSSRSLPVLVPASDVAAPTQLRAAFSAMHRPVTELGPESFNRPTGFDSNPGERVLDPNEFWAKRLPPVAHGVSRYHFADSDTLFVRATHAASSIAIMRDSAGEARLNTSYFLRVLASAVAHSAARPSWKRSLSQPFSDFGATIGNDAGMNVLHEFSPGIMHAMKSHEPKFVSHIEGHFHH
jgi:hypothetical protein